MKISIIIATRNRRDDIRMVINEFEKQTYQNREIIVVDNQSTDGTPEMMKDEFSHIKYLWLPDNHDIRAINIGIEMSDGEIIWRTDSDSHPEDINAFEKVAKIFTDNEDVDIIATENVEVKLNYEATEWYPEKIDKINVPGNGYKSHYFTGSGAAIRRRVYDKIGGFWEYGMEEIEFCTRAIINGFNVRYFPNIRVLHYSSPSEQIGDFRWLQISRQLIRYNWKYFPFFRALGRTTVIFWCQILNGILSLQSPCVLIEGIVLMQYTAIHTIRRERQIVPKERLKDITLGISIFYNYRRFFGSKFKRIFRKLTGR